MKMDMPTIRTDKWALSAIEKEKMLHSYMNHEEVWRKKN
jgi:hypothetical protein